MKTKRQYQCQACGAVFAKWSGRCGECGDWNTIIESILSAATPTSARGQGYSGEPPAVVKLSDISAADTPRIMTGIAELDRVLGGGLVRGSVVLIGGDPGVGKSTLLLQALGRCSASAGLSALYVSGEESAAQIALRAERLKVQAPDLKVVTETDIDRILAVAVEQRPQSIVIDSIQTVYSTDLQSAPGSVSQVRECAARLVHYAKTSHTPLFIIGHVTKDGSLAGPRVLEHMVDTVLYFEGDPGGRLRLVRAFKNRFGAANELGVFAMTDQGLREVANPSAILLSRHDTPVPGSIVMVSREGTRPLLVEVQALADESVLANPRRVAVGLEQNRLSMLLAVLHRHAGIATAGNDIFVNVVGGVRINETAADLAVMCAVCSSLKDKPVSSDLVIFGELGLSGEVRPVQNGQERLREAAKHGFKRAIVPHGNHPRTPIEGLESLPVKRLAEALELI